MNGMCATPRRYRGPGLRSHPVVARLIVEILISRPSSQGDTL
jgi:hypothetical protein